MRFEKALFAGVLALAIAIAAGAHEIEGAYTGKYGDDEYMLIVREIGGGMFFFDLLSFDEEMDFGTARPQPDGRYLLETDDGSIVVGFDEGVCRFMNAEYDETFEFEKLFGREGQAEGVYIAEEPGEDAYGLLTLDRAGDVLDVSLSGWDKEISGHAVGGGGNQFVLCDRYNEMEIAFAAGGCTVTESGISLALDKDESRELYIQRAVPGAGDGSVAGVYRGRSGDTVVLAAVRELGGSILSFELFIEQNTDEFGQGRSRSVENGTVVETDAFRFIFNGENLTWVNTAYDQQIDLERISTGDGEEGVYFVVEYIAMLLRVERTSKDNYLFTGTSYEKEHYFDDVKNENHIYLFRSGEDDLVLSLAGNQARLIANGSLSRLERIGTFPKPESSDYVGVIPKLTLSESIDKPATQLTIDSKSALTVDEGGFRPVTISPNGKMIFGSIGSDVAVYDIHAGQIVFSHTIRGMVDYPSARWSPDGKKIAFTEDFFRMMQDPDIHVIDIEQGTQLNLTDDGADKADHSGGVYLDLLPLWIGDNRTLVCLRIQRGETWISRIAKLDTLEQKVKFVSANLADTPSITGMTIDRMTGRIYYTFTLPKRGDPQNGIWVLDPALSRQIQVYSSTAEERGVVLLADLSSDGEWMILFFPMIANNPGGPTVPAFVLYEIQSRQEYSLLEDETAVINNAVFSPDGSEVLVVFGSLNEQRRVIAVRDVGNRRVRELYTFDDATAGISPHLSGVSGVVGLDWCGDDSLFVATEMGSKAVILKP